MAKRLSIERTRAKLAWNFAEEGKKNGKENYPANVEALAALIRSNGLTNAVAFAHQKANRKGAEKEGWKKLQKHLKTWLSNEHCAVNSLFNLDKELMELVLSIENLEQYRATRKEILALLLWLKRFTKKEA